MLSISLIDSYSLLHEISLYEYFSVYLLPVDRCEIKWKSKMELGSNEERTLTHVPLLAAYFTYPSKKEDFLFAQQQPSQWEDTAPPSVRNCPDSTLPLLQWTLVQNSSSQFLPFLYKRIFIFFVLWICLWFTIACLSWIVISLLFLNNHFCWLNYLSFSFKRLTVSVWNVSGFLLLL